LERTPRERRRLNLALRLKLILVVGLALAWAGLSTWVALPWIEALGESITLPLAIAVIGGIAIVLALFGNFAIVGPMTLAALPLNLLLSLVMFHLSRQAFDEVGLHVRQNGFGFVGYLLTYQQIMSPVSVAGCAQELFGTRRSW
jgi:purine-cytosine permease-like protein